MKVDIQDKAIKELKKIDKFQAKRIFNKIMDLERYPDVPNIKKLTNFDPTHRLRVGDYRVLFSIQEDLIVITNVKHRREAY